MKRMVLIIDETNPKSFQHSGGVRLLIPALGIRMMYALVMAFALISCGGGGKQIPEVSLIPVESGNEFQYIDRDGKIVINPQFSIATVFRDGLALVRTSGENEKWGYISEDGKYSILANYKEATVFSEGLAWVVAENAAPAAIDESGQIKITLQDAEKVRIFSDGLAAFSISDSSGVKWGFVDKDGQVKVTPQFQNTGDFSNGLCAVANEEGKWGYIDKTGKLVINNQFSGAKQFMNGRAVVEFDGKAGLIDESGKYLINPQFSAMVNDGDRFLFRQDRKWGWCDAEGKILINPQFSEALPFGGNKMAAVESGKDWGYIDYDGRIIINPQFDAALPFNGKMALVVSGKKIGFIDTEGKFTVNPQFEEVSPDYVRQVVDGGTRYDLVETDFFNVAAIVKRINFESPEGLSLQDKLGAVKTKLNADPNLFRQYSNDHRLIANQRITNDAEVDFYVLSQAYSEIPDGWYTRRVFNSEATVYGYMYVVKLSGRGYGKGKDLLRAVEKSLEGYTKDDVRSSEDTVYLFKGGNHLILSLSNSRLTITIHDGILTGEGD